MTCSVVSLTVQADPVRGHGARKCRHLSCGLDAACAPAGRGNRARFQSDGDGKLSPAAAHRPAPRRRRNLLAHGARGQRHAPRRWVLEGPVRGQGSRPAGKAAAPPPPCPASPPRAPRVAVAGPRLSTGGRGAPRARCDEVLLCQDARRRLCGARVLVVGGSAICARPVGPSSPAAHTLGRGCSWTPGEPPQPAILAENGSAVAHQDAVLPPMLGALARRAPARASRASLCRLYATKNAVTERPVTPPTTPEGFTKTPLAELLTDLRGRRECAIPARNRWWAPPFDHISSRCCCSVAPLPQFDTLCEPCVPRPRTPRRCRIFRVPRRPLT